MEPGNIENHDFENKNLLSVVLFVISFFFEQKPNVIPIFWSFCWKIQFGPYFTENRRFGQNRKL